MKRLQAGQRRHFNSLRATKQKVQRSPGAEVNHCGVKRTDLWGYLDMCSQQMLPRTANVKGRTERSRAGTHTRLQLLCQTLQPLTAAFVGAWSTPSTNDEAVSTAALLATESILVPLRISFFSLHWYSTVMAVPRANVKTVPRPRGNAVGLADCATSCTDKMLSNSISGRRETCPDADWIQITINESVQSGHTQICVYFQGKIQSPNGVLYSLKSYGVTHQVIH